MQSGVSRIELLGGRLCLDLVNTANWQAGEPCDDYLGDYRDLLLWARRCGLLDEAGEAALRARGEADTAAARAGLDEILVLRAALRALLLKGGDEGDRRRLEGALAGRVGLAWHGTGEAPTLDPGAPATWLAAPVGFSVLELMASSSWARLKACPGERCGWLFIDQSPSGRRQWCSMKTCGNRHKARRHYQRHH